MLSKVDVNKYGRKFLDIFNDSSEEYLKLDKATKFVVEHEFLTKLRDEKTRE
jgi:hypothetical protein